MLLHGGHGNWQRWARNIEALAARFTVWVPDMPGYGDSDTPPEPMLASLIGQLQATLDQLLGAATPIRLAGFSCGGCPPRTRCAGRPACLWPQSAPASWRATSP